MKMKMII